MKRLFVRVWNSAIYLFALVVQLVFSPITTLYYMFTGKDRIADYFNAKCLNAYKKEGRKPKI